ncbi:MAG: aminotransferase class IV [Pseudomonadota bacterium]
MLYWLNGVFDDASAAIDVADRGFLIGDGVFETILVEKGAPIFLDAHLERLHAGLDALELAMAKLPEDWRGVLDRLSRANSLGPERAVMRITVTRGAAGRGLDMAAADATPPTVLVTLAPAPPSSDKILNLQISSYRRSEHSITARCKTLNYTDNILARAEAREGGADEAILLNTRGMAACAAASNLFVVSGDRISTPKVSDGALPGVVRRKLLEEAAISEDLAIAETAITPEQLGRSACFLTNSLLGVAPATLMSARAAMDAKAVETIDRLRAWYDALVAAEVARWNTPSS